MPTRYAFRQVEASPRNEPANNWMPNPVTVNAKIEATGPTTGFGVGQHATAVAGFLAGASSPAGQICTDIFVEHSSWFKGKPCLGDGRIWFKSDAQPVNPFPVMMPYDLDPGIRIVINCSFGDNVAKDSVTGYPAGTSPEQNTFARLKDYLHNTNQVCCAALPDLGMLYSGGYLQNFPAYSPEVIAVGSADFGHEAPDGRQPDCVAYGYTSLTCPQVAAIALRLLYEADKIGYAIQREEVKDLILRGCVKVNSPYTQGAGVINFKNTMDLFSKEFSGSHATMNTTLLDTSFQTPNVGTGKTAYVYNPKGSPWTFSEGSGLTGSGSDFTSGNEDLGQVAFIQNQGSISQTITLAAGTYVYGYKWANRANWGQSNQIDIKLNGNLLQTTPIKSGPAYSVGGGSFSFTGGTAQISLVGKSTGGDATCFFAQFTLGAQTDDDKRKALAVQFGGVYDSVGRIYAIPSDKIQAFASALGYAGL